MWSCVYRDKYGFGRVAASSAAVDEEFNKIKNIIFKNEKRQRPDSFVENHISILDEQMNIVQSNMIEMERNYSNESIKANPNAYGNGASRKC